jgi:hypothetical protein
MKLKEKLAYDWVTLGGPKPPDTWRPTVVDGFEAGFNAAVKLALKFYEDRDPFWNYELIRLGEEEVE